MEVFNDYDFRARYVRKDNAIIGSSFIVLFEKCAPHIRL